MQRSGTSYRQNCRLRTSLEFGLNDDCQRGGGKIRAKGMINCSWLVLDKIKSLSVGMLHLRLFEDCYLGKYKLLPLERKSVQGSNVFDARQGIFNLLKFSGGDCQRQKWQPDALHPVLTLTDLPLFPSPNMRCLLCFHRISTKQVNFIFILPGG